MINLKTLYEKDYKVKCHKCGREMLMPNLMKTETMEKILHPYCCTFTSFIVQWLIHHDWHVRNLGVTDNHPYFCPDCWEEGTPEYKAFDCGREWCEQAEEWRKEQDENVMSEK